MNSKPYTYLIVHNSTGMFYYGVRFAKGCDPTDLWSTYFTSSEVIADMVRSEGKEAFNFEVRRTFEDPEKAKAWEHRVLKKMFRHPLNLNDSCFPAVSESALKKAHATKSQVGEDGLTGYQRAGLKLSKTLMTIDPETGQTFAKIKNSKVDFSRSTEMARVRALVDNPVHKEGVKKKISESVKRAHAEGRLHSNKGRKMPMLSEMLKGNKLSAETIWYTDGISNLRLGQGVEPPEGFKPGRASFKMKSHDRVICPHCGVQGGGGNMKRFHFDNCKQK